MKRLLWTIRLAAIFWYDQQRYAWRQYRDHHQSMRSSWHYAKGLGNDDDFFGEMTPQEALDIDRSYWSD